MRHPDGLEFFVLTMAAFRLVRLVGWDKLTRGFRERLCRMAEREGHTYTGGKPYRQGVHEWITCPWCMGAWVTGAWWLAWLAWPSAVYGLSVPLAAMALVGLIAKTLDP